MLSHFLEIKKKKKVFLIFVFNLNMLTINMRQFIILFKSLETVQCLFELGIMMRDKIQG